MSFLAKLFINDEVRNIINANQVFSRFADVNGRPTSKPVGDRLEFTIESTRDDSFFYDSMFSPTVKCNGEIIFYKRDGLSTLFKMEFANAQILNLSEHFDAVGSTPLRLNISIGWGIMKIRGAIHQETWNPNNPFIEIEETVINDKQPKIIECYYTDLEGNKKAEPQTGDEVYLVLKTENAVGETIDIDLTNHTKDFIYNDAVIEDDIIKDFNVTSDLHKIKLRVIAQQEGEIETIEN